MTDSTATLPHAPAPAAPEPEVATPGREVVESPRRWSPVAVGIWLLSAIGLILFIAFARVPIEAGWRIGRSLRVTEIWRLFTLELAQVAGPLVTPALVTTLVILVLAGALLGLWLAMAVLTDDTVQRPD